MIFDTQFTIDGSEDALYLSHGKGTAQEAIASIVATILVAQHTHTMIDTHWQVRVGLLEDASQLYQVGTTTQVTSLREVTIRKMWQERK